MGQAGRPDFGRCGRISDDELRLCDRISDDGQRVGWPSMALERKRLQDEVRALRIRASGVERPMVYVSDAMAELVDTADRVARASASVLITGESGTGKELIARRIHVRSQRAESAFVAINCAAMPAELESELFGHEKGAFTGATRSRLGKFRQAHGGTLFLDEIGELPLPLQSKLLRVLQERVVDVLGRDAPVPVDVRLLRYPPGGRGCSGNRVPGALEIIFTDAFTGRAVGGGFLATMLWGVRRGLFSNEAGQGSAPIAHAAARTDYPVREGLVALTEPFIDTLLICTMTAVVVVMFGNYHSLQGAPLTTQAFGAGLEPIHLLRFVLLGLHKLAPHMRPASCSRTRSLIGGPVVALVSIGHQHP